jgi:hypothetical protein
MRIIADGYTDLLSGREKIIALQKKYADEWGEKLSALNNIFTRRYETEDQEVLDRWQSVNQADEEEWQSKIQSNKSITRVLGIILVSGAVGSVLFTVASLQLDMGLTPALTLCCGFPTRVGVLGLFIALIVINKNKRKLVDQGPKTTQKPYLPPRAFPMSDWLDLENAWWRIFQTSPVPTEYEHGDEGEEILVASLANRLPDDHYCIKKLMVGDHLDADVVVVGPSGIWILESKYISGTIRVRNGSWSKEKEFFGEGGVPQTEEVKFESFEDQWLREKRAVERAVKGILPDSKGSNSGLIRGGLAFTHPGTSLDFDYSVDVEFKNANHWVETICAASENTLLTDEQMLQLVDSLLFYSSKNRGSASKSSVDLAETLYKEKVARLKDVLKDFNLIEMTPKEKRIRERIREFEENREQNESTRER